MKRHPALEADPVLLVEITTDDGQGAASYKAINWNSRSDRIWLANHMTWALNNGRQIVLSQA